MAIAVVESFRSLSTAAIARYIPRQVCNYSIEHYPRVTGKTGLPIMHKTKPARRPQEFRYCFFGSVRNGWPFQHTRFKRWPSGGSFIPCRTADRRSSSAWLMCGANWSSAFLSGGLSGSKTPALAQTSARFTIGCSSPGGTVNAWLSR